MSKPSFSNIDQWLFELAEGNLTPSQQEQLELFILQHPELEEERDSWEMARVLPTNEVYVHANQHIRRKPVGAFVAMGLTASFLIGLLGLYQLIQPEAKQIRIAETTGSSRSGEMTTPSIVDKNYQEEVARLRTRVAQLDSENKQLSQKLARFNDLAASNTNLKTKNDRNEATFATAFNQQQSNQFDPYQHEDQSLYVNVGGDALAVADELGAKDFVEGNNDNLAELQVAEKDSDLDFREASAVNGKETPVLTESVSATTSRFENQEINLGFKSKVNRMMRSVQRMMDNPVALKNTRDPQYHLPGSMPLDINSSAAGTLLTTRVQTLSRLQWAGAADEQLINGVAVDGYSFGMRGGVGFQLHHGMYNNGGIHIGQASLTYSPKFSVSRVVSVEPSIRLKMGAKTLDHQKMSGITTLEVDRGNVYDYYPDGSAPLGKTLFYKDLGLGVIINTKWFFVGVQGDNLLRHKDNLYDYSPESPRRAANEVFLSVGTDWENQKESLTLSPYLIYHKNEQLNEGWLGLNMRWGWATLGMAASSNVDLAASIGLKFTHFSVSYQADYTKNTNYNKQLLSHQLSLRFLTKMSKHGQRILNL